MIPILELYIVIYYHLINLPWLLGSVDNLNSFYLHGQ